MTAGGSAASQQDGDADRRSLPLPGMGGGLAAGIVLGLLLKAIQAATGHRVYTLLLNVDFLPGLPDRLPELVEFALHLAVAVPLGWLYAAAAARLRTSAGGALLGLLFGIVPALSWFPLTLASSRVPETGDVPALLWWIAAHLIFGLLLYILSGRHRTS